jgi:hypothetical protein
MQDARFDLEYEIFSLKDLAERPHDHLVDTSKNDAFERLGTSSSLSRVIADKRACWQIATREC